MDPFFSSRRGAVFAKATSLVLLASVILTPVSPVLAAFGDGTPTITNPDAFTADKDAPKVDGPTGAFTQRIQLDIPPGRNGLQPDLALQYNSQNTADSIVDYGWNLSVPYIQRLNKTGSQDLYSASVSYTSSLDGELANTATTTTAATTSPSILDTIPVTYQTLSTGTGLSFPYTVPSGGSNKLLVTQFCLGATRTPTATQNGVSVSLTAIGTVGDRCVHWYGTLANPTSGTFSINWTGPGGAGALQISVMTLKDADLNSPVTVLHAL
jgi:hypothetical protein